MALPRLLKCACWVAFGCILTPFASSAHASLFGMDYSTGRLYRVSTDDASLTLIGNTGVEMADLAWSPAGTLYGYTVGPTPQLYRVNPETATATPAASIGDAIYLFEGAMAFSPAGIAYGVNMGNAAGNQLFTFDLATGAITSAMPLTNGPHDINGMAWRSDGMLVGTDAALNALVEIDPATGVTTILRSLESLNQAGQSVLGSNGGLALVGDAGYFATAGPGAVVKGSHELYAFDAFTGQTRLVGALPETMTGKGLGALVVPEPTGLLALALGIPLVHRRRRS